jgi:hypothetical protein
MQMTVKKIPFNLDSFLEQHGKEECVAGFSSEAVKAILAKIEDFATNNPNTEYNWRDYFTGVKEVWAEGILVMPRENLELTDIDLERLEKVKEHKKKDTRCAELVYQTALGIAERNGFIALPLSVSRFLISK